MAAKRRDERQAKVPEKEIVGGARKNRRRWCRGKEGVEHQPKCMPYNEAKGGTLGKYTQDWRVLVCTVCGKDLALHSPYRNRPKPSWVDC